MRPQRCSTSPNDANSSAIGTSITAPLPSSSRLRSAAAMANAAVSPAILSAIALAM